MASKLDPNTTATTATAVRRPDRKPCLTILLTTCLLLPACGSIRGDPPSPSVAMPSSFTEAPAATALATDAISADWWTSFGSPELVALVERSFAASPTLAIGIENLRQAEAAVRIAGASLYPSLGLGLTAGTQRVQGTPAFLKSSGVSVSASYELDLFGAVGESRRAASASSQASRFDVDTSRITLAAGVADAYFQLLALRMRLAIARDNLGIAERVQRVVQVRFDNGAASALDVSRQATTVLSQRAAIVSLELQRKQQRVALAVLTGSPPQGFDVSATTLLDLDVPLLAPGLPSQLLVRRPDLAAAEARLAAANANVSIARAQLLPGVNLSAGFGRNGSELVALTNATNAFSIGASLVQTLFDGGRLRAQVDVARSQERALVESYRGAILQALADTDDALAAIAQSADQEALQQAIRDQARRSLDLSELRYREGSDDLLAVLDAQRTLFAAQDSLAQQRQARLSAALSLYRALGGGWVAESSDPDRGR
jgi:NodT family efflux transporter outer membrane factor (OMF) lipoprotein